MTEVFQEGHDVYVVWIKVSDAGRRVAMDQMRCNQSLHYIRTRNSAKTEWRTYM